MFYTIYKITNLIDGKIYIGKHQTKDLNDDYMGSGKHLKRAQQKYGIENFQKEILFQFDNEHEMNLKEAELVTEEFCLREDNYNLCPGGKGGWGYLNSNGLSVSLKDQWDRNRISMIQSSKRSGQKGGSNTVKNRLSSGLNPWGVEHGKPFKGKKHTKETREKISKSNSSLIGEKNSQYGTIWITNGIENKKIKKEETIPENWYKGRKIRG